MGESSSDSMGDDSGPCSIRSCGGRTLLRRPTGGGGGGGASCKLSSPGAVPSSILNEMVLLNLTGLLPGLGGSASLSALPLRLRMFDLATEGRLRYENIVFRRKPPWACVTNLEVFYPDCSQVAAPGV